MQDIIPHDFVLQEGDKVLTDSRTVARHFGKRHGDVLRAYDRVDCSADFNRRNFAPVEYRDAKGEIRRAVQMTKDGFMFLVMGFTGKEAAAMKEAFIAAFNRMADFIRTQLANAWADYNRAYQQHLSDKREASRHGLGLRVWQDVKPQQVAMLERMHPQMSLFPH